MESRKFDDLTKALAAGTTRRGVLKGMIGGALGVLGLSRTAGAQANKVGICHVTGSATNPYVYITVSTNAIPAHQAHGDVINPDFSSDVNNCGGCGIVCPTPENGSALCNGGVCDIVCDPNYVSDGAGGCVCGLTDADCPNLEVADTEACACYCPVDTIVCDPGYSLDETSCTCVCTLTDADCPNLEVADTEACACYCPVESIVCESGTLNPDTCACEAGPDPECAGAVCEVLQNCNGRSDCFCFDTSEGGGFCAVSVSCSLLSNCFNGQSDCAEGEICLVDTCCGDPVCKPLTYHCDEGLVGGRVAAPIVDDGPTTGHP